MKRMTRVFTILALCAASVAWAGVDINQADVQTLAAELKGVGVKKARAIVDYRNRYGAFTTADELAKVKGISLKTIEKNRAAIEVSRK